MSKELMECNTCGAEIAVSAKTCPKCGASNKPKSITGAIRTFQKIFLAGATLFCIVAVAANYGANSDDIFNPDTSMETATGAIDTSEIEVNDDNYDRITGYEFISEPRKSEDVITGTLKNTSGNKYSYIQIVFNLYDNNGNQIGTAIDNLRNLDTDGTWKFEALVFEEGVAKFQLSEVSAY